MIAFVVALRQTFRRALSIGGPVRRTSSARGAAKALRCLAFVAAVVSAPSFAANYPMELVLPRAVGTAPASGNDAVTARNRIFKAYPGIEYNIRAVVVGGAYPYSYSLSNAPSGMTIDANTGEISWPSPSGTTATPTITVRDAEGTQRSSPWTISVTTSGFQVHRCGQWQLRGRRQRRQSLAQHHRSGEFQCRAGRNHLFPQRHIHCRHPAARQRRLAVGAR